MKHDIYFHGNSKDIQYDYTLSKYHICIYLFTRLERSDESPIFTITRNNVIWDKIMTSDLENLGKEIV